MFEQIDTTIESVEKLYRAVSGRDAANDGEAAPLPPEKDASQHVDHQLDRLLGALALVPAATFAPRELPTWAPPMAILETAQQLIICVDLPGVTREQVTVTATPLLITICDQRPALEGPPRYAEMPRGAFRRDVALPPGAFVNDLTAALRDGVLELRIPRAPTPTPRPISVQ